MSEVMIPGDPHVNLIAALQDARAELERLPDAIAGAVCRALLETLPVEVLEGMAERPESFSLEFCRA